MASALAIAGRMRTAKSELPNKIISKRRNHALSGAKST
jgi:hypothetical protein